MSGDERDRRRDGVRVHVVVHGMVQGVWFRDSCRQAATEAGVAGWVRNRADGTVEGELVGPEDAVARVVAWCRQGPPRAEVTAVDVSELERWADGTPPPESLAVGFRVR